MAEAIGAAGPVSGRRLLEVVAGLGLTQVIGYGTLYYSFSILAAGMAADIGWSQDAVYGAFSALLAGALIGPRCGRWVDRHGAGRIMALGSAAAAAALVACAIAPGPLGLALGLVAIQLAASFVLYEVAFPALVQVAGFGAQRSITHLTLIAGFASTLFSFLGRTISPGARSISSSLRCTCCCACLSISGYEAWPGPRFRQCPSQTPSPRRPKGRIGTGAACWC